MRHLTAAVLALAATVGGCRSASDEPPPTQARAAWQRPATQSINEPRDSLSQLHPDTAQIIGRECRVNFRRDALGMAGAGPIEPGVSSFARKPLFLEGTIEQCTGDWIVLRQRRTTLWIPTSAVLSIELSNR